MNREIARPGPRPSGWLAQVWVLLRKDLFIEWRTREIFVTTSYFGLLVVLIFSFAFIAGGSRVAGYASGILWTALAFSGVLALGRVFERERDGACFRALLLSPVPRSAIYVSKLLGALSFMLISELVIVPAVFFFFSLALPEGGGGPLAGVLLLGTLGYAAVGTLLAAMMIRARSREMLLTIVLYPLVLPILIAGIKATNLLLDPTLETEALGVWVRLMIAFDSVFLVAALWVFEPLVTE